MQSTAGTTQASSEAPVSKPPGLLDELAGLWNEIRGLAHDHLQLAVLETKLAGESLVSMIAAGVMIAILLVTAWLGLLGALVMLLILLGMWPSAALLLAVGLNLLIALALYGVIKQKSRHLKWAATLASLHPNSETKQAR